MSETRVMKNYEELEFRDDFMFGKVMENRELCREVLECLLLNNHSIEWHALPKRSRFYQASIDIDYMNKGIVTIPCRTVI